MLALVKTFLTSVNIIRTNNVWPYQKKRNIVIKHRNSGDHFLSPDTHTTSKAEAEKCHTVQITLSLSHHIFMITNNLERSQQLH